MIRHAANDKNMLNRGGRKFEIFYSFLFYVCHGNNSYHITPDIIIWCVVFQLNNKYVALQFSCCIVEGLLPRLRLTTVLQCSTFMLKLIWKQTKLYIKKNHLKCESKLRGKLNLNHGTSSERLCNMTYIVYSRHPILDVTFILLQPFVTLEYNVQEEGIPEKRVHTILQIKYVIFKKINNSGPLFILIVLTKYLFIRLVYQ